MDSIFCNMLVSRQKWGSDAKIVASEPQILLNLEIKKNSEFKLKFNILLLLNWTFLTDFFQM